MPTIFVNLQCSKEKTTCLAYKYINIYTYVRDMLAYLCMCRLLSLLTHIICKWTQYVVLGDMNLEQSSLWREEKGRRTKEASLELSCRESLNKWKLCTQSECSKQTDNTLGLANDDSKKPMMKEELVVTSAIAQTILQALEILSLHADGNNSWCLAKTMVRSQHNTDTNWIPFQKKSNTQHIYRPSSIDYRNQRSRYWWFPYASPF